MIEPSSPGRHGGFLTSLPGILTAVAAIVTAVGGLYLGFRPDGTDADQPHTVDVGTAPSTTTTDPPPAPEPIPPSEINLSGIDDFDAGALGDDIDRTIDDCAAGSVDACTMLLEQLTLECEEGYGLSCDALYAVSPVGSDYEYFGATCGGRFAAPYDGWCADL